MWFSNVLRSTNPRLPLLPFFPPAGHSFVHLLSHFLAAWSPAFSSSWIPPRFYGHALYPMVPRPHKESFFLFEGVFDPLRPLLNLYVSLCPHPRHDPVSILFRPPNCPCLPFSTRPISESIPFPRETSSAILSPPPHHKAPWTQLPLVVLVMFSGPCWYRF